MLDEDEDDEDDEDDVLHKRRGTLVLRCARPKLAVPTSSTRWLWPGAQNSRLWPRGMRCDGKACLEVDSLACGQFRCRTRVLWRCVPTPKFKNLLELVTCTYSKDICLYLTGQYLTWRATIYLCVPCVRVPAPPGVFTGSGKVHRKCSPRRREGQSGQVTTPAIKRQS